MKIKNILAIMLGVAALTACSDDDKNKEEVYANPYTNPLTDYSAADPTIHYDGNRFYLFATNTTKIRVSDDLIEWRDGNNMFSKKPTFNTDKGAAVWAPDIEKVGDKYILYFAMSAMGGPANAGIGIASADTPEGPFSLACSVDGKGKMFTSKEIDVRNSIDPAYYDDGDKKYLAWGSFNGLYMIQLTDDGLRPYPDLAGAKANKIKIAGNAFEAPHIHKHGDYYYLFASVGSCCNAMLSTYMTVVGRSTSVTGPYLDRNGKSMVDNGFEVVIRGNDKFVGPGHNSQLITDKNGRDWILYHSYFRDKTSGGRYLMLDEVVWEDGWPRLAKYGPSSVYERPQF